MRARRRRGSCAASARAKRVCGASAATASASSMSSTSRSSGSSPVRRPSARRRSRWTAQVVGSLIGTPAKTASSARRRPIAQYPPSGAAPSTASAPRSSASACVSRAGVSCGVSIPTTSAAPPTSAKAAASRSPSPSPRCAMTSKPGRQPGARLAVEDDDPPLCRGRGDRRERVGERRAGQGGGLLGRAGRRQPGLAATGHRRLGDDDECGHDAAPVVRDRALPRGDEHARHVAHGAHRAAHRAGHLRAPGARPVGHVDLADPPAARRRQQHHLQRPAEAAVADRELQQRAAPRGAHRAEVAQAQAAAAPQLEREHAVGEPCVERHRAGLGLPRAEHEVALAASDRVGDERQVARIERRVAVHEADDAVGRGEQPGVARGAEARLRLVTRRARRARRRSARSRRSIRCRRRAACTQPACATGPRAGPRPR